MRLILETWRYLALVILVGLVCYVTAAPRRPIRSPVMGRVPNHEGPHLHHTLDSTTGDQRWVIALRSLDV